MAVKTLKPTGKAWVIVWVSYDYNDQFYYPSGDNGDSIGTPNAVYLNKAEAELACLEENAKQFAGLNLENFTDGDVSCLFNDNSITNDEHVAKIFEKLFGVKVENGEFKIPEEVPLKNLIEFSKMVTLEFYTVVETGIYGVPRTKKT